MVQAIVRFFRGLLLLGVLGALVALGAWSRDHWLPLLDDLLGPEEVALEKEVDPHDHAFEAAAAKVLELSPQARQNLSLVSRPARLSTYRRMMEVPGEIADRPGVSDRGVTSPVVGIVTAIHAFPGETVRPGDRLFTLRLLSEYVQNSQSELFKATHETELELEKRSRLSQIGEGVIPGARLIEIDQQVRRLQAAITSYRQDLLARGLSLAQVEEVAAGRFISTVEILAPPFPQGPQVTAGQPPTGTDQPGQLSMEGTYEVQELKADLGTQVQAGQLLGIVANHRMLMVVGRGFKREAPAIERAAEEGWPIGIEFAEDAGTGWPPLPEAFEIQHVANMIDHESRTFDFYILLANQSRSYTKNGKTFVVWRFRPGQRVRLQVPVEELPGVIVLPAEAVVREGPEAYVFRQNGDLFNRLPVHVLHADRHNVVIANDGSVAPGWFLAQGSASSLNRVLAAQSTACTPVGMHVHADGTVHGAH